MFWEIAEDIRNAVKMTILPALRNLFSSFKSLIGMFLVMLVLQMILSVVCISGIENIKNQQTVLNDFQEIVTASDKYQKKPQTPTTENASTEQGSDTATESETADGVDSEIVSTALNSTSIFVGAVIIWGVCAITVYQKVTFAAADRDKYIWGMLITHGAKVKKIRGMLKWELYIPHLAATVCAYPLSALLYNYALRDHGYNYKHSIVTILAILVLSYICIRLVVEYEVLLIKRMSCNEMLREEDAPKSVCYPRRHSRLIYGFSAPRYATNTFIRMRKYYLSLAAIAAIPAIIWTCFSVSATSEDKYLASDIGEFAVKARDGIGEEELNKIINKELSDIEGISFVRAGAYFDSAKIYTHMLSDGSHFINKDYTPFLTSTYADNTITLCYPDKALESALGYAVSGVTKGTVKIISPANSSNYNFGGGDKIYLAVSKLDGSIRTVTDPSVLIAEEIKEEWSYIELEVTSQSRVNPQVLTKDGYVNVNGTYFLLNKDDFETITALSVERGEQKVDIKDVKYTTTLDDKASFTLTIPRSLIKDEIVAGDRVDIGGRFYVDIKLTVPPKYEGREPSTYTRSYSTNFTYTYVNSVTYTTNDIILNVSPCETATLEATIGISKGKYIAFGTPPIASNEEVYCPATAGESLELTNGSVVISSLDVKVHTGCSLTAAEVGTHAIISGKSMNNTDGLYLLENIYADSSFVIACNDPTTRATLGVDGVKLTKSGTAVLVLPSFALHNYKLSVGDRVRFAVTVDDVADRSEDSTTAQGSYDTLSSQLLLNKYEYVSCQLIDVIYSDSVSKPHVFVSTGDYTAIINKEAPYINFTIYLRNDIDSTKYGEIRKDVGYWASGKTYKPTTSSTGEYLQFLLRKNANYSTLISLISILIPFIVPFIWYYPMTTLHERRKTEFKVLDAMGKRRSQLRATFAIEGALVSASAFITVILATWPAMFVFKTVCKLCSLPLEFEYANLTLPVLLTAAALSAVCAAASFALSFVISAPKRRRKIHFRRKKYGNS